MKVAALAGRRVDTLDASRSRFPFKNAFRVERDLETLLRTENIKMLVSSAACGADLLGLSAAGRLGLRTRIILPFDKASFVRTSVTCDPEEYWMGVFDSVFAGLDTHSDIVDLGLEVGRADAYAATTAEVVNQTLAIASESHGELKPIGILVWDGKLRDLDPDSDESARFSRLVRHAGLELHTVLTI